MNYYRKKCEKYQKIVTKIIKKYHHKLFLDECMDSIMAIEETDRQKSADNSVCREKGRAIIIMLRT